MNTETYFLYVEDDPLSRMVMELLLVESLGFPHLVVFDDSTDFMKKIKGLPDKPEVIFLDIHMEPVDGFTMLHQLRIDPEFKETTVVALTASVMNEEVNRLRTAGFNSCISKPIDQDTFPRHLTRILNGENVWTIY